ncbi:MAG: class I SAM-dependent methyltransferase [Acidimicrobiia bacterium]|nr:class I SAM-dependent methyltransferase [Acidimicrobiia bacterium]MDH4308220.1 class I SAM-dependent methyltransferase [Acidimicrobiia bacterium]MDH5294499.1 class I SAM-dependent methyltransferase [Acidimicrobiia bacterium]
MVAEISDLICSFDPESLERLPVRKAEAMEGLGRRGRRIVGRIADTHGVLDPDAVDLSLVSAHLELQRLNEEFCTGLSVCKLLEPMIETARSGGGRPIRVVEVGCGIGYLTRWLSARGDLRNMELVGYDFNPALVERARFAAALEGLRCRFETGDALRADPEADIVISMGVLHHFHDDRLSSFFAATQASMTGFLHFDLRRTWLAPMGAWLFHRARMRTPLARHDGVASAIRAHPTAVLMLEAGEAAPEFAVAFDRPPAVPITRVVAPVVGVRRPYQGDYIARCGPKALRLEWVT